MELTATYGFIGWTGDLSVRVTQAIYWYVNPCDVWTLTWRGGKQGSSHRMAKRTK